MDVLPVVAVPVLVEPAAPVAEVGLDVLEVLDVAPVPADGVALVAVEAPVAVEALVDVEAPAVAVPPAEELVAAAGVLAA